MTGSLYIHASCNMKLTTPCETMLSQFFKNLANIFFVLSASCSTCSEFHLLFLTTRCRCSVTVLSTKLLCCNTIPSVHSSSTLNKCSDVCAQVCTCTLCENSVKMRTQSLSKWYKPSLCVCVCVCGGGGVQAIYITMQGVLLHMYVLCE